MVTDTFISTNMPRICIFGCRTVGRKLHVFPNYEKESERFKTWISICRKHLNTPNDDDFYKSKRVCDEHFIEDCKLRCNRISNIAIPTLKLQGPSLYNDIENYEPSLSSQNPIQCSPGTPLHGFPNPVNEPERFRTWLYTIGGDILKLDNQYIHKYRNVCRKHFERKYHMGFKRLSNIAVPTLLISGQNPDGGPEESNKDTNVEYLADWDTLEDAEKNPATSENVDQEHGVNISHKVLQDPKKSADKPIFKIPNTNNIVKVKPVAIKIVPHPQMTTRTSEPWRMNQTIRQEPLKTDIIKLASLQAQIPLTNDPLEINTGCEKVDNEVTIEAMEDIKNSFDAIDDQSDDDYRPSDDDTSDTDDDDSKPVETSNKKEEYIHAMTTSGQTIKVTNLTVLKKYGPCRCCLKEGTHSVVDISVVMEPLNIVPLKDPRVSALLCSDCSKFLQEAKTFRNMAAASEKTLFDKIQHVKGQSGICLKNIVPVYKMKPENMNQTTVMTKNDFIKLENKMKLESVEDFPERAETPIEGDVPDSANKCEEMDFSELSDTDSVMTTISRGPEKPVSARQLRRMVRTSKREESECIRENFKTLLRNSTLAPFVTSLNRGHHFMCIYCSASFKHFTELRPHIETHDEENYDLNQILSKLSEGILRADISYLKCKLCYEILTNIDTLVEHLVKIHDKVYYDVSSNPPHRVLCFDLSSNVMKCIVCGEGFEKFRNLVAHMNIHYGSHLCEECGATFIYFESHRRHMMDHKTKLTTIAICDICGEKFKSKLDLNRHRSVHFPPSSRSRKKKYKALGLKDPRKLELANTEQELECKICGTKYPHVEELYTHRLIHLRSSKDKTHKCDLCSFETRHKNYLSEHFRRHWGIRKYQCKFCKSRWINQHDLKDHEKRHAVRLQCPLCATCFVSKEKFGLHIQTDHSNVIKTVIEQ